MTDETETTTEQADPAAEQKLDLTGWSRKAVDALESEFAERVERFVRHHNAEGARMRPLDSERNNARSLTVQVIDEAGRRVEIGADAGKPWLDRLQAATFGLKVVIDIDEHTALLMVLDAAAAAIEASTEEASTEEAPRSRRARRGAEAE